MFAETGELTRPKQPRILFVDEKNDCWGLLAESIAKKAFPDSGTYESAGYAAASEALPVLQGFLGDKGLDRSDLEPTPLPTTHDQLDDYDLIIGLGLFPREHLAELPFRTVFLGWDVIPAQAEHGNEISADMLDAVAKDISHRLHELMETLHGENGS